MLVAVMFIASWLLKSLEQLLLRDSISLYLSWGLKSAENFFDFFFDRLGVLDGPTFTGAPLFFLARLFCLLMLVFLLLFYCNNL